MTVKNSSYTTQYTISDLMSIKYHLIHELVRDVLIGQTDAFVAQVCEMQVGMDKSDLTRDGIQAGLEDVKAQATDYLDELMADIRIAALARIAEVNYGAVVTGIEYNLAGDITDITVDVTVS